MRRETCLKLKIGGDEIFVRGTWLDSHFDLSITDGLNAWLCHAGEEEVRERAEQWDQEVGEYIHLAERHLGFIHPDSTYSFDDAGFGSKRLSWTFDKEGTKLEWRWKCQSSTDPKKTTSEIMNFLMDANIRLREEVVKQSNSCLQLKEEVDKCLAQSERFCTERREFESAIYAKFLLILNTKKKKLKELRDKLSNVEAGKGDEEQDSTDEAESFDEAE